MFTWTPALHPKRRLTVVPQLIYIFIFMEDPASSQLTAQTPSRSAVSPTEHSGLEY